MAVTPCRRWQAGSEGWVGKYYRFLRLASRLLRTSITLNWGCVSCQAVSSRHPSGPQRHLLGAVLQTIQIVRPCLHYPGAVGQIVGVVSAARRVWFDVG